MLKEGIITEEMFIYVPHSLWSLSQLMGPCTVWVRVLGSRPVFWLATRRISPLIGSSNKVCPPNLVM